MCILQLDRPHQHIGVGKPIRCWSQNGYGCTNIHVVTSDRVEAYNWVTH